MSELPIREPDDIRLDCARKLAAVETSGMFSAILGGLLGEDLEYTKDRRIADHA